MRSCMTSKQASSLCIEQSSSNGVNVNVFSLSDRNFLVCSGALALADAAVPVSGLVAAVSVGLMRQPERDTMQGAAASDAPGPLCSQSGKFPAPSWRGVRMPLQAARL